ncbi:MAG: glycosyl transferase, group 1 [Frankiales bacterium]|nr:glycosyl transferase, group 1 [Frankiales bacterium]
MRIAMVSEHASPLAVLGGVDAGGQNVHVAALATALARRGHEVVVHTRRDNDILDRRVELTPHVVVDHVDAGPAEEIRKDDLLPLMRAFAEDLRAQWTKERPDVVHAHFWMSALAALDAARPLKIPVVVTFHALGVVKRRHQGDKDTSPPERLGLERRVIGEADHIVATCTDEAFELMRLGADRSRITIVPCGVDTDIFRPDGPRAARTGCLYRLVYVGRLVERKGVGNIVTALADIPETELVIAGGPEPARVDRDPEVRRLTSLAAATGVLDRVRFIGRQGRAEVAALMRSADVAVCVPWYEPFGIVPLEAMACGVPLVASAVGGLIDTVVHGVTGVHVPARDPQSIAGIVNALLAQPTVREQLGRAGAKRVGSRYTWERVAAATEHAYDAMTRTGARSLEVSQR